MENSGFWQYLPNLVPSGNPDAWGDCLIACPYQIFIVSSGEWWSLLLDMRCLRRHNITSYSRLQTNVLAKFLDTTCILFYAHSAYSLLTMYQLSAL